MQRHWEEAVEVPIVEPDLDFAVAGAVARGLLTASVEFPEADAFLIAVPTASTVSCNSSSRPANTASSTSPQQAYSNRTLNPNPTSATTPNAASAASRRR